MDDQEVRHPDYMPTGYVAPGAVYEVYAQLGFMPFHGWAVLWRTSVLWRTGRVVRRPARRLPAVPLPARRAPILPDGPY
ncbi:hypothetical protein OG216_46585 (plasmid) [Streptomycetaceae bacterium NBC_01309]